MCKYITSLVMLALLGGACGSNTIDGGNGNSEFDGGEEPRDADPVKTKAVPPDSGGDAEMPNTPDAEETGVVKPIYRLVEERNLASPVVPATGITHDDTGLWIMSGNSDIGSHRLVRFDPDTRTIDRDFTFANLEEVKGASAGGIAWDGTSIWIVVSGGLQKLVTVNPTSGQIAQTMSVATHCCAPDLDFIGGRLWLSTGASVVRRINPGTGGIEFEFRHIDICVHNYGIAMRANGEIWIAAQGGGMLVFDGSGKIKGRALKADGTLWSQEEMGPSVFLGTQLVTLSARGITYYSVTRL